MKSLEHHLEENYMDRKRKSIGSNSKVSKNRLKMEILKVVSRLEDLFLMNSLNYEVQVQIVGNL